jgi:alkylation response protein AidB-like acyl-CoA dehydrogenase
MSNFYKDNDDLRFYMEKYIDWESIVRLTEVDYRQADGYDNAEDAVEAYREVMELVGEFAGEEIAPLWEVLDREKPKLVDGEVKFAPRVQQLMEQIAELGLHGLCVPRELGGMNAPLLVYMANAEMFARADVGVMTHISFHCGIAMALLVYSANEGSVEVDTERGVFTKVRFSEAIGEMITGQAWGSMDITEPNAGSDMAALRTRAEQDDDGNWFLTGQKIFITSGHGKYHIVIARSEPDAELGLDGLSLFLVRLYDEDADGNRVWHGSISRVEEKLGHASSPTCAIEFERTPAELIGERGEGFKGMLLLMNNARVGVTFEGIGISEAALRMAREYAEQRPSMGKTIDRHEMVADYLREMAVDIQAMRALAFHGCYHEEMAQKLQIGLTYGYITGEEAREAEEALKRHKWEARRVTPLGKYFSSEKAVEIAKRAIQIHGGVGYTKDYAAEKLLRDAMVLPIYEGTSQIQSLMAMKDNVGAIVKDPGAFVARMAGARWRSISSRCRLERRVAALELRSLKALQFVLTRTAAHKFADVRQLPASQWAAEFKKEWDPKRDFALAMLHAERLTKLLTDATVAELFWEQSQEHEERREVLERWLERAEPRSRAMLDEITTTGRALLAELAGA